MNGRGPRPEIRFFLLATFIFFSFRSLLIAGPHPRGTGVSEARKPDTGKKTEEWARADKRLERLDQRARQCPGQGETENSLPFFQYRSLYFRYPPSVLFRDPLANRPVSSVLIDESNQGFFALSGQRPACWLERGNPPTAGERILRKAFRQISLVEALIFGAVNRAREGKGRPLLRYGEGLHFLARRQAGRMAFGDFVSHTDPREGDWPGRARSWKLGPDAGENILRLPLKGRWRTSRQLAEDILESWRTSKKHWRQIISEKFWFSGVGIAFGRARGFPVVYACQLFSARRKDIRERTGK